MAPGALLTGHRTGSPSVWLTGRAVKCIHLPVKTPMIQPLRYIRLSAACNCRRRLLRCAGSGCNQPRTEIHSTAVCSLGTGTALQSTAEKFEKKICIAVLYGTYPAIVFEKLSRLHLDKLRIQNSHFKNLTVKESARSSSYNHRPRNGFDIDW